VRKSLLNGFKNRPIARFERGFTLVVALLLMVALSLIGVTALRNVSLQEKMAGNFFFRIALTHENESALRTASQDVATKAPSGVASWPNPVNQASLAYWSKASNVSAITATAQTPAALKPGVSNVYATEATDPLPPDTLNSNVDGRPVVLVRYFRTTVNSTEAATGASAAVQDWTVRAVPTP
jgi:type IV pilus assembly protein PilX